MLATLKIESWNFKSRGHTGISALNGLFKIKLDVFDAQFIAFFGVVAILAFSVNATALLLENGAKKTGRVNWPTFHAAQVLLAPRLKFLTKIGFDLWGNLGGIVGLFKLW